MPWMVRAPVPTLRRARVETPSLRSAARVPVALPTPRVRVAAAAPLLITWKPALPDTTPLARLKPLRSSTPLFKVRAPVFAPRAPVAASVEAAPRRRRPALTTVAPVKVFAPLTVTLPVPLTARLPAPETALANTVSSIRFRPRVALAATATAPTSEPT